MINSVKNSITPINRSFTRNVNYSIHSSKADSISFSGISTRGTKSVLGQLGSKWENLCAQKAYKFYRFMADITYNQGVKETIAKVKVPLRKSDKFDELDICLSQVKAEKNLSIRKDGQRIADVSFSDNKDFAEINFIDTLSGREQYRGLEKLLMNLLIEYRLTTGSIPTIKGLALPIQLSQKANSSMTVFSRYGVSEIKPKGLLERRFNKKGRIIALEDKEAIRRILQKKQKTNDYILPYTKSSIERYLKEIT